MGPRLARPWAEAEAMLDWKTGTVIDHEGWREVRILRRKTLGEAETISDDRYAAMRSKSYSVGDGRDGGRPI